MNLKGLIKIIKELNAEEGGIYDLDLIKDGDCDILIDKTEESYYERWLLKPIEDWLDKRGMYLECDWPGRYIICE